MADAKISALPAATTLQGDEEFPMNDGGTTRKITAANMAQQIQGMLPPDTGGGGGGTSTGGTAGATGATGPAGADGLDGSPGSPGGATGATGAPGAAGATGPPGLDGVDGLAGTPGGATGPTGTSGSPGQDGVDGLPGGPGATGATGAGATGATGPAGIDGIDGRDGRSGATGASGPAGGAFVGAKAYADATQNINNTTAALTFNQEEFDSDGFHDTGSNTSRMTVPAGKAGKYLLSAGTFGSGGADFIGFRLNGTTAIRGYQTALTSAAFYRSVQAVVDLAVGDYVEVLVSTTNNINVGHASLLDAQSWVSVVLLGGSLALSGEISYDEITTDVTVSSTTEASPTDVISASAHTFSGSTAVYVEFFTPVLAPGSGSALILNLWDGATDLGRVAVAFDGNMPCLVRRKLTPSAGSHTYKIRGWRDVANGTVYASSPRVPAYLRVVPAADSSMGLHNAYAMLRDEKTANTSGGAGTTGSFQTRTLNTESFDPSGIVSLSSNQFTLDAGSYFIKARAPFYSCARTLLKIRNITDSSDAVIGQPVFVTDTPSESGAIDETMAFLAGRVTIAGTKTFELQYRIGTNNAGDTSVLGIAANYGVTEVYAEVEIWREA